MTGADSLYPASPPFVPEDLTKPSAKYRWRVLLTLIALIVFLACYFGLMVSAAALAYYIWEWDVLSSKLALPLVIVKYASLAAVALFFGFLLRGLFLSADEGHDATIELAPSQAPKLFAFLDRLCEEIGARRPRRVLVSPEVEAAVRLRSSALHLIFPPSADLIIGLWLVNTLNLSEFKAVLAHELAHTSQKSTRLGNYLFVAYRVTKGIVYSKGQLDKLLEEWMEQPILLGLPAVVLKGFLSVSRRLLKLAMKPLERSYLALSRAQELHADQIAAAAAGTDALVNALYKLRFASVCFHALQEQLAAAAQRGIYTSDLYYHQEPIAARLRRIHNDPSLGIPPPPPQDSGPPILIFDPTAEDSDSTHPSFYKRELNLKRCYLRCPMDERPAWLLFDQADRLRFEVTRRFYEETLEQSPTRMFHPAQVQQFIDGEFGDLDISRTYGPIFCTTRPLPGDPTALLHAHLDEAQISAMFRSGLPPDVELSVQEVLTHLRDRSEVESAILLSAAAPREKLSVNGQKLTLEDMLRLLDQHDEQVAQAEQRLHAYQRSYLAAHLSAARILDQATSPPGTRTQWLLYYVAVHQHLTQLYADVLALEKELLRLFVTIVRLSSQHEEGTLPPKEERARIAEWCTHCVHRFQHIYTRAKQLRLPPLTNVPNGTTCYELVAKPMEEIVSALRPLPGDNTIDPRRVVMCIPDMGSLCSDLARVQVKSAAAILRLCQQIATEWHRHLAARGQPERTSGSTARSGTPGSAEQRSSTAAPPEKR